MTESRLLQFVDSINKKLIKIGENLNEGRIDLAKLGVSDLIKAMDRIKRVAIKIEKERS